MQVIIFLFLAMFALAIAAAATMIYGIPLLVTLLVGLLSIPIEVADLLKPANAFKMLDIRTSSNGVSWAVRDQDLKAQVSTSWITVLGMGLALLVTFLVYTLQFERRSPPTEDHVFAFIIACVGLGFTGYFCHGFSLWVSGRIYSLAHSSLTKGVAGLEHAAALQSLSAEVCDGYLNGLGTQPPPDACVLFHEETRTSGPGNFMHRIQTAIQAQESCLQNLRTASAERQNVLQLYTTVAKKVNRVGTGSLLAEMDELFTILHSDQLGDLARECRWQDYLAILGEIHANVENVEKLAATPGAQSRNPPPDCHNDGSNLSDLEQAMETLGVGPDDSFDRVKMTYHNLVKQLHPDRTHHLGPAETKRRADRFLRVQQAMEICQNNKGKFR